VAWPSLYGDRDGGFCEMRPLAKFLGKPDLVAIEVELRRRRMLAGADRDDVLRYEPLEIVAAMSNGW
jgi:hypothetical protein